MQTHLYSSPVFGPVHSRRLGVSLGINLLPADGKVCSFDCVYCECGFNAERKPSLPMPTIDELHAALHATLLSMQAKGQMPDVITFAGNGEPTLHPHFDKAVDTVIALRNAFCPKAKVSVLSNATRINRPQVREALMRVDNNIQKLDTVDLAYIQRVDRPNGHYDVAEVVRQLKLFNGHVIIQTLFMGSSDKAFDNTDEAFVAPWLNALKEIGPSQVMLYTIDRPTPQNNLFKATPEQLQAIAARVSKLGIAVSVSY